ncbi:MAG: ROK family protein [Archaeoglobus sp.]|nr:ROK family protein [Archaeoglobus sp.]
MPFLGVDIGGTNTDIVLFDKEFIHLHHFSTKEKISEISKIVGNLEKKYGAKSCIGLAAWIREGKILKAPNLPQIIEFDLIENDANCFTFFAARKLGFKNLLGITIGTGIGAGVIVNGKIYRGRGLAGEIGHSVVGNEGRKCVCGGEDHLEAYFGGWAIRKETGKEAKEIFEADENVIYKMKGFDLLCKQIASASMLMDFEAVVFGGRIGARLSSDKLKEGISKYIMPEFMPEIVTLKDELAVAKGAAILAKEGF